MKPPNLPENEAQRLQELNALTVDLSPEERFDRLTRLAKRLFDVPISVITLIGKDLIWIKTPAGLLSPTVAREISFCGHAILDDGVMVVENALLDDRFHDNPLVTGSPNIRFYAGCPIRCPGGSLVGSLCLIDNRPREFMNDDVEALKDLAAMAEAELAAFQIAITDELTQISNRRGFMAFAQMILDFSKAHGNKLSLAFLDLDNFKAINDKLGHKQGDNALIDFANTMRGAFNNADLFARLGGDEFVVLFNDASKSEAERAIQQFERRLEQQCDSLQRPYHIEFSSGIVEYMPSIAPSLDVLLKQSDELMYQAKKCKKDVKERR